MAWSGSGAEVIQDTSYSCFRRANSRAPAKERHNFMSPNLADMYTEPISKESATQLDLENEKMDITKLFKDIEYLASSHRTWKERKELENRNVVALGGKPPKKQRLPLSVAKVPMKKQKQREQKKLEEELLKYGKHSVNDNREEKQRKPEDRVLKASEGHFKKGVLNVKHLLGPISSKGNDPFHKTGMGKKKGNGKGKGKGKGRKGKGKKGKGIKKRS